MSEDLNGQNSEQMSQQQGKIIDETSYRAPVAPRQPGPAAIGKGGDPLFRRIRATKEQLTELLDETTTVQDWIQRETCNNVALACLDNENLKEAYFEIKNGFGEYGPIVLMGFKTPQGVEIPRLKVLDKNGEVKEVLTGPMAIEEINKRVIAYRESLEDYIPIENAESIVETIQDYSGNPNDYI